MPHNGGVRKKYSLLEDGAPTRSGPEPSMIRTHTTAGQADGNPRRSKHRTAQSVPDSPPQQQLQYQYRERRHNRSYSGNSLTEKRPPTPPLNPSTPASLSGSTYQIQLYGADGSSRREQRAMTPTAGFADSDVDLSNRLMGDLSKKPFLPNHLSYPARKADSPALTKDEVGDWVNADVLTGRGSVSNKTKRSSRSLEDYYQFEPLDITEATAYDLTHAANTILIPPIPFYSRSRSPQQTFSPRRQTLHFDEELGLREIKSDPALSQKTGGKSSAFRQTLRGVWEFLKTPKGIIAAIYGFLVAFWGAAIVIFLLKIINLHNDYKQKLWVEISSQIENGLFTITGIGMIPFRAIDTYRMIRIWQMKRRTAKLRSAGGLPHVDEDDLPDPAQDPNYVPVLTVDEQEELRNHQLKFQRSQTWYRPFATETNKAFSTETALVICCLNDGNSAFQILLCATMWGLNRYNRPAWTTGLLIPCAFGCAIGAAVLSWRGGRATRRSEEDIKARAKLLTGPRRASSRVIGHIPMVEARGVGKR